MKTEDSKKLIKAFKALGLSIIALTIILGFIGFVIWAVLTHPIIIPILVVVIIIGGLSINIYENMN